MKKEEDKNTNIDFMFPLLLIFMMFSNTSKDNDSLKGIEKQLDEIKWLLAGK